MKALQNFDNRDKLRLLHDLFPQVIPQLLDNILDFSVEFKTNIEKYQQSWDNGFMPINYWLGLSEETAEIIKKHKSNMVKSSRVFSDHLSYTYAVMYVNDRIVKFADTIMKDHKFKIAVDLLFN